MPVLFLISEDNTTARYFVLVALIFLVSMSMLLIIFVPLFIQIRRAQVQQKVQVVSSRQMNPQLQQFGSQSRSSSPMTFNSVSKNSSPSFNSMSNVLYPIRERQEFSSDGQGQESQESSTNGMDVTAAAAMPV